MVRSRGSLTAFLSIALALVVLAAPGRAQAPDQPSGAKTWVGHAKDIEDYLKTAEVLDIK